MPACSPGGGDPVTPVIPSEARNRDRPDRGAVPSIGSRAIPRLRAFGAALGMPTVVFLLVGCDRGVDLVRERITRRSRVTIDSLTAQNASLQRQMVMFERISAEKDTLLREVRDAHILIEFVRRHLADVEDSSRVRGERLLEAARDNDRLRSEVEEHLRTIDGQKDLIATYLVRIAELETMVTALTDSTRKLTEANEVLIDSLARITSRANAAWYVVGTREQLVRAGVLTEEGGLLGFGKTLAPSRAMVRNAFTRIDRLRDTVIALPGAKEYRIVSRHDPGLVDVQVRRSLGGTLLIRDPERFWSSSAWLIVVYD
jgi:hypothetical protein